MGVLILDNFALGGERHGRLEGGEGIDIAHTREFVTVERVIAPDRGEQIP